MKCEVCSCIFEPKGYGDEFICKICDPTKPVKPVKTMRSLFDEFH